MTIVLLFDSFVHASILACSLCVHFPAPSTRYFGLPLSRWSKLHHQYEGQELPPVFTPETENPMDQAVPQSRQQR